MHTFWIACSLERYSLVSFCFFFPGGGGYLFICLENAYLSSQSVLCGMHRTVLPWGTILQSSETNSGSQPG